MGQQYFQMFLWKGVGGDLSNAFEPEKTSLVFACRDTTVHIVYVIPYQQLLTHR